MARLLQLSDMHIVAPGTLCSDILDTGALLRAAVDEILTRMAAIGPLDAVLVTGDISDDGSAESYALAQQELARLGLPVYAVPGNHDHRENFRLAFGGQTWMPEAGAVDWAVNLADTLLIGLDTLVEGQGAGRLQPESLEFLTESLRTAGDRSVVVALHHPPLHTGIRFMDNIGLENTEELAAAIPATCKPAIFVSGHVHSVYLGRIGPHRVVTAPSLCSAFGFDMRPDARVGFFAGPTGYALLDSGAQDSWTAQPLFMGDGPFDF